MFTRRETKHFKKIISWLLARKLQQTIQSEVVNFITYTPIGCCDQLDYFIGMEDLEINSFVNARLARITAFNREQISLKANFLLPNRRVQSTNMNLILYCIDILYQHLKFFQQPF